jgi:flagellar biogenesis protein FliO
LTAFVQNTTLLVIGTSETAIKQLKHSPANNQNNQNLQWQHKSSISQAPEEDILPLQCPNQHEGDLLHGEIAREENDPDPS